MHLPLPVVLLVCISFFSACTKAPQTAADTAGEVLVVVGENTLTLTDLRRAIPAGLPEADSTSQARAYIRWWIDTRLLALEASRSVRDLSRIDRQVEQYRAELLARELARGMTSAMLAETFSSDSVDAFYAREKSRFRLTEPIYRGVWISLPASWPRLREIKKLMASTRPDDADRLEKEIYNPEISYTYFRDSWLPDSRILRGLPAGATLPATISPSAVIEYPDDGRISLLLLTEKKDKGEIMPREVADPYIRQAMELAANDRLFSALRRNLFRQACDKGDLQIYCNLD